MDANMDVNANTNVVDVSIERTESMTVTFEDGQVCVFPVVELRSGCPCATCRGMREKGQVVWPRAGYPEAISILNAEFSGAWGISLSWSDGHDTGIYAWSILRRWWDAGFGSPLVAEG
jgi:DUF971 family protein